jgi:hypothetical protein
MAFEDPRKLMTANELI